ncbi:hypothetical protein GL50803_0093693 [Giardia duodenalis]|uniref:Uncharacterized protein n=1 Tax=Giardia intestinalis (strain ATCC 50803 / WB clone C6) TaxID=184922 RepID=A8BRD7_GIAIC|nr:hypothetical protein GL50803_0093693 [Giardia intestinalis]KAE8304382.1 hypothetical protein GL50803_0093693 [Giardia intestinalis]|eukprot:XP_001705374.1 Hypothetical protein GL50803_93693 [Giardia lamblia ATCC 50803]
MSFIVLELSFLNMDRLSSVDLNNRVLRVCRVTYSEGSSEQSVQEHQRTRPRCRITDEELRSLSLTNELISKYIDYADFIYTAIPNAYTNADASMRILRQKPLLLASNIDTYHALITEVSLSKSPLYKFPVLFLSTAVVMNIAKSALLSSFSHPLNTQLTALTTSPTLHTVSAIETTINFSVMTAKQHEKRVKKDHSSVSGDVGIEPTLKQSPLLSHQSSLVQSSSSMTRSQTGITLKTVDGTIELLKILLSKYRDSFERYLYFYMSHTLTIPNFETMDSPLILRVEADRYVTQEYLSQHCPDLKVQRIRHSLHGLSFLLFESISELDRGLAYFSDQFAVAHPPKTQLATQAPVVSQSPSYLINFFDNPSLTKGFTQYVPPMQVSMWPMTPRATVFLNIMAPDLTQSLHNIFQQKRANKEGQSNAFPLVLNKFSIETIPCSVTNLVSNMPAQEKKEDTYRVSLQTSVNIMYPFHISINSSTQPNDAVYQFLIKSKHLSNCVHFTESQALALLRYGVIHVPKDIDHSMHSPYLSHGSHQPHAHGPSYGSYGGHSHNTYANYSNHLSTTASGPGRPEGDAHYYNTNSAYRKHRPHQAWNTSPSTVTYTSGEGSATSRPSRYTYGQPSREYIMPHSNEVVCIRLKGANTAQAKDLNSFLASLKLLDLLAWNKYCVLSRSKGPIIRSSAKGFGNDNFWLLVCANHEDATRVASTVNDTKFMNYTLKCEISTESVDISDAQRSIACFIPDNLPNPCTVVSLKKLRIQELKRSVESRSIAQPDTYQESPKGIALFYGDSAAAERALNFYRTRIGTTECMLFTLPPSWYS